MDNLTINELKAQAYDLLVQIEQLDATKTQLIQRLQAVNQEVAKLQESEPIASE